MEMEMETITINNEEYVKKSAINSSAKQSVDGFDYCIVRTYSAGVFAGYIKKHSGQEATVLHARRLWYWKGAASLSQLSVDGVKCPKECKFPCEVEEIILTNVIEILKCTEAARISIKGVEIWKR